MSENDINKTFSRTLKYYLAINKMTQRELAKKLDVGTSTVNDWVLGKKSPRMGKVDKMCSMFGCRRSDFLEDKTSEEEELLENYRALNSEGKEKVLEYISMLTMTGKYKWMD